MSTPHPEIPPELRHLAQAILDRLDPAVRAAAAMATETLRGPGRCQQVWCPVCALAALVNGEQHPLLSLIAEHSVALLAVVRAMAADPNVPGPTAERPTESPSSDGEAPPTANGRYQRIPIVVETDGVEQ